MTLTATICEECHVGAAVFRVARPHQAEVIACDVCAAKAHRHTRGTTISHLDRPATPVAADPATPQPGLGDNAGTAAAEPRSGTRRRLVLDALRAAGEKGATDDELCAATGLDYSNLGPRRRELMAAGWVIDTGISRLSDAGVQVAVYSARRQ